MGQHFPHPGNEGTVTVSSCFDISSRIVDEYAANYAFKSLELLNKFCSGEINMKAKMDLNENLVLEEIRFLTKN